MLSPAGSITEAFNLPYLTLTNGLNLLVIVSAGKLYADDHSKAKMRNMTGLKQLKDQGQAKKLVKAA